MSLGQALTPSDLEHVIAIIKRRVDELPIGSDERHALQTQLHMRQRRLEKMLQLETHSGHAE